MPSSILNSDDGVISGTSGLKNSGGDDGVLVFQSKGTETARINTDSQIVTVAGTASLPPIAPTGDLNTGIYFPGADRVGFATGGSQRGEFDASGNFAFNSGYGSVATAYGCRAWVNFDGTGTPAIREDGNVSSITDNGTGDYTVNFTTAMPDANYEYSFGILPDISSLSSGSPSPRYMIAHTAASASLRVLTGTSPSGVIDFPAVNVAIFR